MGGGTHSDYYEGETHTIQGKVMGALENAKVTLYLDDKSEPIAKADVQNDGSYSIDKYTLQPAFTNPLATEPLFMVLQKDLTDIN